MTVRIHDVSKYELKMCVSQMNLNSLLSNQDNINYVKIKKRSIQKRIGPLLLFQIKTYL